MSGSNSSVRDAAAEPLGLTVHSVPTPDLSTERRRTARGRLKMLLVLAVCAAPVVASYFTYFVIRPEGRSNYGELVLPTRATPDGAFRTLDGQPVPAQALAGQWLLLVVGPADCGKACEERLYMQRQLREMLGRERTKVDKLWLITDSAAPAPALLQALESVPGFQALRADPAALARWLPAPAGGVQEDHLYVVDPMGELMMRMPANAEPAKAKRDLERLLRAAASWDQPGR
jgi:hypothetical protein